LLKDPGRYSPPGMSETTTVLTPKTPSRVRNVDAIISARKQQLLSAKARNDELFNTLAKHAEVRSAQKAKQHRAASTASSLSASENDNGAINGAPSTASKATPRSSDQHQQAALKQAQQMEAVVLTTVQQQMNDLRTAQESSAEEIKEQMSALDDRLASTLDERIRLALQKKSDRSATTSPTFGGSSSGSPLGNFGGSAAGSPTYPRTSVTDRLDAVNAKLALREGDIRAVSRAINITVVHNHPINSSDLRSQRFTLNG
jgi:hypothetical protein